MSEIYKINLGNYTRKELEICLETNRVVLGKALAFNEYQRSLTLEHYQEMDYIVICHAETESQREKLFYESEFKWGFDYRNLIFYFRNEIDAAMVKLLN